MAEWSSCFSFASLLCSAYLESSTVCGFIYRGFLVVWLNYLSAQYENGTFGYDDVLAFLAKSVNVGPCVMRSTGSRVALREVP